MFWREILVLALFFIPGSVRAAFVSPPHTGFITDQAQVLTEEEQRSLEAEVQRYERATANEIGVLTMRHLPEGESIEDVANAVFRSWGIGKKEKNNGVLFLVVVDDRLMRIEVGYGLEGDLTDIETRHIQDEVARPAFRAGRYGKGIADTIQAIEQGIDTEARPFGVSTSTAETFDEENFDQEAQLRHAALHVLEIIGFVILETVIFLVVLSIAVFLPKDQTGERRKYGYPSFLAWMLFGFLGYLALNNLIIPFWSLFYGLIQASAFRRRWHVTPGQLGSSGGAWTTGSSSSDSWSSSDSSSSESSSSSSSDFGGGSSGGGGSSSSW